MLPSPSFSFTIPSIHDGTDLVCRIYHPYRFVSSLTNAEPIWQRRGAIIAHPYAPLGGSYDDDVVRAVAEEFVKKGFVVGTFNFRGAGGSKGRTSWTGKSELSDYVSFVGFFLHYLHNVQPHEPSNTEDHSHSSGSPLSPIQSSFQVDAGRQSPLSSRIKLVLGGYSYGSLIAINIPPVSEIIPIFYNVTKGTNEAEIRLRAANLSSQVNQEVQQARRRGRCLTIDDSLGDSVHSMIVGGEESDPGLRRSSRDSKRSIDMIRKSMDRSRAKFSLRRRSSGETFKLSPMPDQLLTVEVTDPQVHYLLISPLLPPASMLATMFTKAGSSQKEREFSVITSTKDSSACRETRLTRNPTLAIYGDKDFFTSHKKLRRWADHLSSGGQSRFRFLEVAGAGHFWHDSDTEAQLRQAVKAWAGDIADSS